MGSLFLRSPHDKKLSLPSLASSFPHPPKEKVYGKPPISKEAAICQGPVISTVCKDNGDIEAVLIQHVVSRAHQMAVSAHGCRAGQHAEAAVPLLCAVHWRYSTHTVCTVFSIFWWTPGEDSLQVHCDTIGAEILQTEPHRVYLCKVMERKSFASTIRHFQLCCLRGEYCSYCLMRRLQVWVTLKLQIYNTSLQNITITTRGFTTDYKIINISSGCVIVQLMHEMYYLNKCREISTSTQKPKFLKSYMKCSPPVPRTSNSKYSHWNL